MALRFLTAVLLIVAFHGNAEGQVRATALSGCAHNGVAVAGYDIVSYYSSDGPVLGTSEHAVERDGVTFVFRNAENRAKFLGHEAEYLPAYGGWCATTVAHGALLCPDFSNYKIENGRLLFFEVTAFTNGRAVWNSDPMTYRRRADANYPLLTAR